MVKLASTLPKEHSDNGLEGNTRHLLGIYTSQEYMPIVALVRTKEILNTEDFTRVPKLELMHVELAIDGEFDERARRLLLELHDARVSHIQQPLDLPDPDSDVTDVDERFAIGMGEDVVDAELVDDDAPLTVTGKDA